MSKKIVFEVGEQLKIETPETSVKDIVNVMILSEAVLKMAIKNGNEEINIDEIRKIVDSVSNELVEGKSPEGQ